MENIVQLDSFELKILSELQLDGRISNQSLAEKVGLSAAPCWRRLKSLQQRGFIRHYTALLAPEKLGIGQCVFAHVKVTRHNQKVVEDFEKAVREIPHILECYATMGSSDYLMKLMVKDVAAYDELLHKVIFTLPGISNVESFSALKEIKYDTSLVIKQSNGLA